MNLREYLAAINEKPHPWAKRNSLPKDPVYRAVSGKPVGYQSACQISKATGDLVTVAEIMRASLPTSTPNEERAT